MSDPGPILPHLPDALRLVVGAVLLLSGFAKLLDAADFARVLGGLPVLPARAVKPIAKFIPGLELGVGGWLAFGGRGTNAAAALAGGLLVVFAVVLAATLLRGHSVECGCFGRVAGGRRASWRTVGRNAILAGMAVTVVLRDDAAATHVVAGLPALFVVVAAVVGAILVDEILSTPLRLLHGGGVAMRSCTGFLALLSATALLTGGQVAFAAVAAQSSTPPAEQPPDFVVVATFEDQPSLRLVDPTVGEVGRWPTGSAEIMPAVVPGPPGILFASRGTVDGKGTDVVAISAATARLESMARITAQAAVRGMSSTGDRLFWLTFDGGLPTGVASVPLPDRWQGPPAAAALGGDQADGLGLGIGAVRWYGLDPNRRLWLAELQEGKEPVLTDLGFTMPSAYWSVLVAPDGRVVYAIDYFGQRINVIDVARREVTQSVGFGREQFKRPECAAALAPQGDRLFVLGNTGNHGDGILVFDTRSWQQVDHLLAGRDFYCVVASPDGRRLYASTMAGALVTIDAQTGTEQRTVELELTIDGCCPRPLLAVGSAA